MSFPVIATVYVQPTTRELNTPTPIQIRLEQLNLPLTEYNSYPSIQIESGYCLELYDNNDELVQTFSSGVCNISEYLSVFSYLKIRVDVSVSNPEVVRVYPRENFKGEGIVIGLDQLNMTFSSLLFNWIGDKISVIVNEEFKVWFQLSESHPVELLETGAYNHILTPTGFILFQPVPDTPVSLMTAPCGQVRARLILTPEEIAQFQQEPEPVPEPVEEKTET